jgi:hypothetical protein
MEYESNSWYEFYYHYMHFCPSCIVIVKTKGCLMKETIETLKKNPLVIIHDIKKIEEDV